METTWLERLTNPDLIFGLAVRFFGVFLVLIIVMIGIWLVGLLFVWMEQSSKKKISGSLPEGLPVTEKGLAKPRKTAEQGTQSDVPEEVAAVVALHLQESEEGAALVAEGGPVQGEVAAAISLSLARYLEEQGSGLPAAGRLPPIHEHSPHRQDQESPWKLLGRQETFSRRNPLPSAKAGNWRGR